MTANLASMTEAAHYNRRVAGRDQIPSDTELDSLAERADTRPDQHDGRSEQA